MHMKTLHFGAGRVVQNEVCGGRNETKLMFGFHDTFETKRSEKKAFSTHLDKKVSDISFGLDQFVRRKPSNLETPGPTTYGTLTDFIKPISVLSTKNHFEPTKYALLATM